MYIPVIDNGGQWTHREWRLLRTLNVKTEILPNTTDYKELEKRNVDALVLSGGSPRIEGEYGLLGELGNYIDELNIPMLCICVSHQFLALHYKGKCGPAKVPSYGKNEIIVDNPERLFINLPSKFIVWESHNDEIKELPSEFELLAHSENCTFEAIKHKSRPIYGLQFHPEVENTQYGKEIFENFLKIVNNDDS